MKQRLFIAIPIPSNVKSELIGKIKLPTGFKITRPENIHITLLFLGDTSDEVIPQIINIMEKSLSDKKIFELSIESLGQFPERGYPNIIFATGKKGLGDLMKLADDLRIQLGKKGFKDNKPFKYHITVARKKFMESHDFIMPEIKLDHTFKVNEVILYKSDLQPSGPVYTDLKVINLKE
ncbi:MAG: RNA 2',3'-cyclic phosphodiesterase [Spirochaetes bacterium]|nr:RNA 2',3'-cyclic phosphodiesterase [Spirochaetota bacterium]